MPLINENTNILLDSDVVRHFIKGGMLPLLKKLYGDNIVILDIVRNELFRSSQIQTQLENFIAFYKIEIRNFP